MRSVRRCLSETSERGRGKQICDTFSVLPRVQLRCALISDITELTVAVFACGLQESMAILRELLGWNTTGHSRLRSGSRFNSSLRNVTSKAEEEVLRSRNALDLELYDHAVHLFERHLATGSAPNE